MGTQQRDDRSAAQKQHRSIKLTTLLIVIVCGMFAFSFALVPIYNSLCKTLGINGKIELKAAQPSTHQPVDVRRWVDVEFVATKHSAIPWAFYPKVSHVRLHPGEVTQLAFYAENTTNHRMSVQAIPSVTPGIAAKYIKKTECFCFTQQTLNGHEAMNMPLIFHLDPDLPANVNTITLAYTLFDVTDRVAK